MPSLYEEMTSKLDSQRAETPMKDFERREEIGGRQGEMNCRQAEAESPRAQDRGAAESNGGQFVRHDNSGSPGGLLFHVRPLSLYGGDMNESVHESPFHGPRGWVKRTEDVVLSGLILFAISPLMAAIALGIKLSSPGPVFFIQRRHGIDGKEIMVPKFRTMTVCEDGAAVLQATRNDQRVTRFGGFLRKTSLDELPQFINVLQGSMSIVGPRPHAVAHTEYYRRIIAGYMLRHKVKPGITGWAQVNGLRGETPTVEKMVRRVQFDLDYIRHWSFWLDMKILFKTVVKEFTDKNAY